MPRWKFFKIVVNDRSSTAYFSFKRCEALFKLFRMEKKLGSHVGKIYDLLLNSHFQNVLSKIPIQTFFSQYIFDYGIVPQASMCFRKLGMSCVCNRFLDSEFQQVLLYLVFQHFMQQLMLSCRSVFSLCF